MLIMIFASELIHIFNFFVLISNGVNIDSYNPHLKNSLWDSQ